MAYVAVKGGTAAIAASQDLILEKRVRKGTVLAVEAVQNGMAALVDQVMSEASLYSEEVAALAIKQAEGSPEEAVFLLRAFRSTLPRKYYSITIESSTMQLERRISASFKDIPGGQILGPSLDYSHRLLDFGLWDETVESVQDILTRLKTESEQRTPMPVQKMSKVIDYIRNEGLLSTYQDNNTKPKDITKESLDFPTIRSERLQALTRGQTGALTAFGYASLRGYGVLHPTVGELRVGLLPVSIPFSPDSPDEDDAYYIGEIRVTEVESLIPVSVPMGGGRFEIEFDIGYGFSFGQNETKTIAMSLIDQGLERPDPRFPTQDEEFVLLHIDSVEATGFISHLKLPHYVTFQSKLDAVRSTRKKETIE